MIKKIIFIAVIFLSFCNNIYAETFYGEYRSVLEVGNYKEDEVYKESYKIYNTYKKEYIDLGYIEDNELYIKDENDYVEKVIDNDEYIEIVTPTSSVFQFLFYNIPINTKINELEIYIKETKDNYSIYNKHKLGNTINYLNDNNLNTSFIQIYDKTISILLSKRFNINDIILVFHTDICNDVNMNMLVGGNKVPILLTNNIKKKHIITFNYNKSLESDEVYYKNKETRKLYKHNKENIIKLNNYVKEGENILLDDYKEINNIFVRDKLILKDNLIINNKNIKILDLIEYSTDNVFVDCNINYKVNGIYSCDFILNDIKITKDITIDIKDNNIYEFKEELLEEPEIETNKDEEVYLEHEKVNDNNIITKDKNIQINKEKINININRKTIKKPQTNSKDTYTVKKQNISISDENNISKEKLIGKKDKKKFIYIIKCIILFILIIIEITLYKKRKRNNVESV